MTQHMWAIVSYFLAMVAFALAAVSVPLHPRVNLVAVGLLLLTVALFISDVNVV
jgi:NhaP-type Na+/H+ or K+/H+ antiporter